MSQNSSQFSWENFREAQKNLRKEFLGRTKVKFASPPQEPKTREIECEVIDSKLNSITVIDSSEIVK